MVRHVGLALTVLSVDFSHFKLGTADGVNGGGPAGTTPGLPDGLTGITDAGEDAGVSAGLTGITDAGEDAGVSAGLTGITVDAGVDAGVEAGDPPVDPLFCFLVLSFPALTPNVIPIAIAAANTVTPKIMLTIFHFSSSKKFGIVLVVVLRFIYVLGGITGGRDGVI